MSLPGFMAHTEAKNKGAIKTFEVHFWSALVSIFIYSQIYGQNSCFIVIVWNNEWWLLMILQNIIE